MDASLQLWRQSLLPLKGRARVHPIERKSQVVSYNGNDPTQGNWKLFLRWSDVGRSFTSREPYGENVDIASSPFYDTEKIQGSSAKNDYRVCATIRSQQIAHPRERQFNVLRSSQGWRHKSSR